ncbi:MAG TPA: ABC transporter ATP-binding protein [Herpetosiphonaceae bacterium]
MTIIEFENVSKHFIVKRDRRNSFHERMIGMFRPRALPDEEFWALRDVSFRISAGETVGLIGHNGSGKSTTLKLITRILDPSAGSVAVDGRISALLELGSGFHHDLTGRENIYLNGSLLGISRPDMQTKIRDIIAFSELEEFIDMPIKHYSSGMYMRLGFAVAISVDPDILITDEVLAVGDEAFQRKCMDRIYALKKRGKTILFVSHALGQVRDLCDRALWFDHGKLLIDSEPNAAIDAYLGETNQRDAERLRAEASAEQAEADEPAGAEELVAEPEANPHRWGNYEAEIVKVELLGGEGEPVRTATTGASLTVRMHYVAHERIDDPVFGLAIHHRNGLHINGPNSRWGGLPIPAIEGEGYVDYTIPELPLLEGDYEITAAIYDHTMVRPFDHHDRMYPLKVYAPSIAERFGAIYIPSQWSWQPRRTK